MRGETGGLTSAGLSATPSNERGVLKKSQNARSASVLLADVSLAWRRAHLHTWPDRGRRRRVSHRSGRRGRSSLPVSPPGLKLIPRSWVIGETWDLPSSVSSLPEGDTEPTAATELVCTTRLIRGSDTALSSRERTPWIAGPVTASGGPVLVTSSGEATCTTASTPRTASLYAPGWHQRRGRAGGERAVAGGSAEGRSRGGSGGQLERTPTAVISGTSTISAPGTTDLRYSPFVSSRTAPRTRNPASISARDVWLVSAE